MAKHTLTYENGTTVDFEDFQPNGNYQVSCRMPESGRNRYNSSYIYVNEADYQDTRRGYGTRTVDNKKIRIGILANDNSIGIPKGVYIPYTLTQYGEAIHALEGLYEDYIFNERIKNA